MTRWEYTYLWWEGSATSTANGRLGHTTPPIGEEVMDKRQGVPAERSKPRKRRRLGAGHVQTLRPFLRLVDNTPST